jgi:hypothetical protein
MTIGLQTVGTPKRVTASGNAQARTGAMLGVFCNSTAAGTLTFYDDAGTGTATLICGPITPAAGTWTPLPFAFGAGLNVVVGGAIDATLAMQG